MRAIGKKVSAFTDRRPVQSRTIFLGTCTTFTNILLAVLCHRQHYTDDCQSCADRDTIVFAIPTLLVLDWCIWICCSGWSWC
jgi:hypothetical protein